MADAPLRTVLQGGRPKAYRPLPEADRLAALGNALAAYDRGHFFLAHELLEPAWMGTDDLPERNLYQGLIKLSAAFVHAVRGNPAGVAKNLRGARDRLIEAEPAGRHLGIDTSRLVAAIDLRLSRPEGRAEHPVDAIPIARRQSAE
jgi:predicted metal-dependent hydrolase